ncbi:MAG TPA: hypothetical protein VNF91_09120 [Candidatus Acidoferrum sp.]|nr:hypothetical protein [Candidatus Acidoferrum sp.]
MAYLRRLLVGAIGAATLVGAASVGVSAHEGGTLVEFDSMTPVTGAAVGAVNDRGIKGGGLPWVITSGRGEVTRDGHVSASVKGLIIEVAPVNGKNPIANFSATVSCITPHGIVNVTTGLFPATSTGDATISANVMLPHPCRHPEVFVGTTNATTGAFAWFAMSNAEEEGDD